MEFEPHEKRVIIERNEISEKLEKLTYFLSSEIFKSLHGTDQNLLISQKGAMDQYLCILNFRIERFKK